MIGAKLFGPEWYDEDTCVECGRPTAGERCQQCDRPLCPMCYETQGGFCERHPDENFRSNDMQWYDEGAVEPQYIVRSGAGYLLQIAGDAPAMVNDPLLAARGTIERALVAIDRLGQLGFSGELVRIRRAVPPSL